MKLNKNDKTPKIEDLQDVWNHDEFKEFTWDYEKQFYDVKLPSGEIIAECWPNAWLIQECKWEHRKWDVWECKIKKSEPTDYHD